MKSLTSLIFIGGSNPTFWPKYGPVVHLCLSVCLFMCVCVCVLLLYGYWPQPEQQIHDRQTRVTSEIKIPSCTSGDECTRIGWSHTYCVSSVVYLCTYVCVCLFFFILLQPPHHQSAQTLNWADSLCYFRCQRWNIITDIIVFVLKYNYRRIDGTAVHLLPLRISSYCTS